MIVHLNGWPGVGKLTVGRLLARKLGARLIDNHLLHDIAIRCAGLKDPERWQLYEAVRSAAYRTLAEKPRSETFVMTNALCFGAVREREAWGHVVALAQTRGVALIPIVLEADERVLRERVQSPDRENRKLADADTLSTMIRSDWLLKPDVPDRLDLDTTHLTPDAAAAAIERHVCDLVAEGRLTPPGAKHLSLIAPTRSGESSRSG